MAKSKHAPKANRKSNAQKTAGPETEDDYLEAADEQEKGGHKWKAGDAVKAVRFFARAIDIYDAGLEKFPNSADLAYNKAHLTFAFIEEPRLAEHLGDRSETLQVALEAHREAMRLDNNSPDIIFNTAQVLTSLAEEHIGGGMEVVKLLQEATELFSWCLDRQEMLLYEFQAELERAKTPMQETTSLTTGSPAAQSPSTTTQWARVEEPVTVKDLLETCYAMLACLEGLLAALAPAQSKTLANIAEIAGPIIHTKIPSFVSLVSNSGSEKTQAAVQVPTLSISSATSATFSPGGSATHNLRKHNIQFESKMEAAIVIASFQVALAEGEYRSGLSELPAFSKRIQDSYEPIITDRNLHMKAMRGQDITQQDVALCVAYAEAYNSTLGPAEAENGLPMDQQRAKLMLGAMLRVDELLTFVMDTFDTSREAPSMSTSKRAQILLLRGDTAFRVHRVMRASNPDGNGASSYVFQADKHYQAAVEIAEKALAQSPNDEEVKDTRDEASFKATLSATVMTMETKNFRAKAASVVSQGKASELLDEVVREGLLEKELAYGLWHA